MNGQAPTDVLCGAVSRRTTTSSIRPQRGEVLRQDKVLCAAVRSGATTSHQTSSWQLMCLHVHNLLYLQKMKLRPSMTALVWERTPTFLIEVRTTQDDTVWRHTHWCLALACNAIRQTWSCTAQRLLLQHEQRCRQLLCCAKRGIVAAMTSDSLSQHRMPLQAPRMQFGPYSTALS
jgi:hypothetical protein